MRFEQLTFPPQWKDYWTKYPHGMTILEALIDWVTKTNDLIDNVNDWNTYLNDFVTTFDDNLKNEVTETVQSWIDSGYIEVVISAALQTQIDEVELQLNTEVERIDAQLADITYNVNNFNGATDNEKIGNAFAFMNGLSNEGATLSFPTRQTSYILTSSVVSNGKWNLKMDKEIEYNGTGTAITFQNAVRRKIEVMVVKGTNYGEWFTDADRTSVGVKFDNINWCEIKLNDIRGFYTNVLFDNTDYKGSCYNNVFIGVIYDGLIGIHLKERIVNGTTVTWNNQNQFFGGAIKISGTYSPVKATTTSILNEGNNNTFIGTALEGNKSQYSFFTTASDNSYINCRYEDNLTSSLRFEGVNCRRNLVLGGYGLGKNVSQERPANAVIFNHMSLLNLGSTLADGTPAISAFSRTTGTQVIAEFGSDIDGVERKNVKLSGDGTLSFYNNVSGDYPQLEITGRYGDIKFGHGSAPTRTGITIDSSPLSDLIKLENFNYEFRNNSSFSYAPLSIPDGTTTINISKANVFMTVNTSPVSINSHTGGREGKPIYLVAGDGNTTLAHGSGIKLKGATSRLLTNGEVVHFLRINGLLVEV